MDQGCLAHYLLIPLLGKMGVKVSMPCDPTTCYDLLADNGKQIYRLQVKSCNVRKRNRYRADIARGHNGKKPYDDGSIDFFVVQVPGEEAWYVIPQRDVNGQRWVSLYPHDKCGKYERYRNAWQLMLS